MADSHNSARVALVVGASGGIGAAVASRLMADGLRVYGTSHRHPDDVPAGVQARQLDLGDAAAPARLCAEIFNSEGHLDILVNCAAMNLEAPALGLEDDVWDQIIAVNLSGAFRLCRDAAKFMLLGRWGRIINFSSIAASYGGRGQINYVAAKGGVEAFTRTLALELGRKGVLVNCVAPGIITTPMSARLREQHEAELLSAIAVRRFGLPTDVAEVVAFLASDAAAYITGQVIHVDGGMGL